MPEIIYNTGLIITVVTIVLSLITFLILFIKKVKLEKQLHIEYGGKGK